MSRGGGRDRWAKWSTEDLEWIRGELAPLIGRIPPEWQEDMLASVKAELARRRRESEAE